MSNLQPVRDELLQAIKRPEHQFAETLAFIQRWFVVQPSAFVNNGLENSATENQGSCQVLALAELLALTAEQCLLCFGEHYRQLANYPSDSHLNIRQIVARGLQEIRFDTFPLTFKE